MWHRSVTRSYKGNDTTRGKSVEASKPWEIEINDNVMTSLHPHLQRKSISSFEWFLFNLWDYVEARSMISFLLQTLLWGKYTCMGVITYE